MRFALLVLIACHVHLSTSKTADHKTDCSVYVGLNITWKVKDPSSPRLSEDPLRFGLNLSGAYSSELPVFRHLDLGQPIPEEFDARQKWPNCSSIKEIRDQGNCGSCWAVSSASAMSDRICIHSNGKDQVRISALDLSCCKQCSSKGILCEGGTIGETFVYWAETGIVTGGEVRRNQTDSCRPYPEPIIPEEMICKTECSKGSNLIYEADKRYGMDPIALLGQRQMQLEIMKNGPIVAEMRIYDSYDCYESGIYHRVEGVDPPHPEDGHAIKIIGWGVENRTPYWLMSDSHGESFGENGIFRMVRGIDDCGIESMLVAAGLPRQPV